MLRSLLRRKTGLVLGSGSARGLAHIGVLKSLDKHKIKPDFIAGSSIGALIGGIYAAGIPVDELEKIAVDIDSKTVAKFFIPGFSVSGLFKGNTITKLLHNLLGDINIEELKIPMSITSTDILTGQLMTINSGNLVEAIRASISIPIIFTPVEYGNGFLVDGGLLSPVPIDVVKQKGKYFTIAVNVIPYPEKMKIIHLKKHSIPSKSRIFLQESLYPTISKILNNDIFKINIEELLPKKIFKREKEKKTLWMKDVLYQSLLIAQSETVKLQVKLYKPNILIEPDVSAINIFDFHRAEEAIETGFNEAEKKLREAGLIKS